MNKTLTILLAVLPLYMASCASTEDKVVIPLDDDPRIGDEVKQVCFTSNIRSWSDVDNDRNALILKMSNRDEYKLRLSPGCDPQWARMRMAVISRNGSCLTRGDRIKTDGDMAGGYTPGCVVTRINQWKPDAIKKAGQSAEEVQTGQ